MKNDSFLVLTGAMGGGKSTLLKVLGTSFSCVPEPARKILAEQRAIGAAGVPEKNPDLFTMLMLSRAIHDYSEWGARPSPVVFDRGVPDMLAYARLFGLDLGPYQKAAEQYRYNDKVFFFPAWEEIYATDDERKISFEGARDFGFETKRIYESLGYTVVDVPLVSIAERAQFILGTLKDSGLIPAANP